MRLLNDPQGSDAWKRSRAGKWTGSTAGDLMAKGRGGAPSTSRANLIAKLAIERITGEPVNGYVSEAMKRGTELEPFARAAYEAETGCMVEVVGFALHDTYDFAGASLDGIIPDQKGNPEFKCPDAMDKHYQALLHGTHAEEYAWQVAFEQWIAETMWTDVVSYDPRYPEGLQLAITRVPRDHSRISDIRAEVLRAEDELQSRVRTLLERRKA
jgi:hypothetical protein